MSNTQDVHSAQMPSSPSSYAFSPEIEDAAPEIPSDDAINNALISTFHLTSEGGFICKDVHHVPHREKNYEIQVRVSVNGVPFWINAREVSLRLNAMQRRRINNENAFYVVADLNNKTRVYNRMRKVVNAQLHQYEEMNARFM